MTNMATIICPQCRKQFQGTTGTKVNCPYCHTLLETPLSEKQKKEKSTKVRKRVLIALLIIIFGFVGAKAADYLLFTREEYYAERAELEEKRKMWEEKMEDLKSSMEWNQKDLLYFTDPKVRARAQENLEKLEREYNADKFMRDQVDEELDQLTDKYESGIWYKLFGK